MAFSSRTIWQPSQAPSSLYNACLILAKFLLEEMDEGEIRDVNDYDPDEFEEGEIFNDDIDEMEEGEIRDVNDDIDEMEEGEIRDVNDHDPDEFEEGEIFNDDIDEMEEGEIRYVKDDDTDEFEEGEIRENYHDDTYEMEEGEIRDGNANDTNEMEEGEIRDGSDVDSDEFEETDIWDGNDNATDASDYDRDEGHAITLQEAQEPFLRIRMDISIFLRTNYTDREEFPYEQMLSLGDEFGTYNKGLSLQNIAALPYKTHNVKDGKTDTCVICQFDYEDRESLIVLDCKHSYHRACITQWLQINNVCSLCKREVSLKA